MRGDETRISARDIVDVLVEVISECLLTGDFDAFAAVFHAPQQMLTMGGLINMETREDMRRGFDEIHEMFRRNAIVTLQTKIGDCRFVGADRIESSQVTEGLTEVGVGLPPFAIFLVIQNLDGSWKVTKSEFVLAPDSEPAIALATADAAARDKTED